MIERLIRASASNPILTIFAVFFVGIIAAFALTKLPLDALPDLSDTQVIVFADWPGRSPDLIEDQVTYPLVTNLLATPQIKYVRGLSMAGAAQVVLVFADGTDPTWARTKVNERLSTVTTMPSDVTPVMGPEATGLGWVYQYALADPTGQHNLAQLRSLQDWNLKPNLQSVQGVAEIATVGGFVKQYQVLLDPLKLAAFNLSPLQITRALRASNQEVGANVIEMAGTEFMIRGRGYLTSVEDMRQIPVSTAAKARTITLGDISTVQIGPAPRSGVGELDGEGEAVGGIVVMRNGENALKVIDRVKARIDEVKKTLPKGIEVVSVYDRSSLIERAIDTLKHVLLEEILIVCLIVSLFLWHLRGSLVTIIPLPIAVLLSFLPMLFSHLTVNIMSLGGIALAIGAMVDAGIILVENAHKKFEGRNTNDIEEGERKRLITDAMVEMGKPLFFSLLVITVSFLPIFALEGREGRLFKPLAFTKTFSMAWAALLAVTLTPALAILFLKGKFLAEDDHPVSRIMHRIYHPVVNFVVRFRKSVVLVAFLMVLGTVPIMMKIPTEFMPALNEGTILYMPTAVAGMSIDTAAEILQKQNRIIKELPEVEHVFGKAGRANSSTDPAPLNMFETVITLKPKNLWRPGIGFEQIVSELDQKLQFPGMPNIWWMPIQTRIEMLSTGVRTAVGIKVMGPDLRAIAETALNIESALKDAPGTKSVFAERAQSGSFIDIDVDRRLATHYGLNIADIHAVIETVLGGSVPTTVLEGRERYGVQVRYAADFRSDLNAIEDVIIPTFTGAPIKLGTIAKVRVSAGSPMIASENGQLLNSVFVNVDPAIGLEEYVKSASSAIDAHVKLPEGVRLEFAGQFQALQSAKEILKVVIPLVLMLIFFLLYINTKSIWETLVVLTAVPFSLIGAFWLMWILGYKLSIASWIGLLALAGLDAETGVVMLLYLTQAYKARVQTGSVPTWSTLTSAIHEGAVKRVRPKVMTVAAALLGLLPVMWSTGTGAEVMKRIAAPMVGGLVTSGLLELLVYPAIFAIWKGRASSLSGTYSR